MARGVGPHVGAVEAAFLQDIKDGDAMQGLPVLLTGSADAINPHQSGNYIVTTAGVDSITLGAPTAGVDDNLSIVITSGSSNAHTVTLPSALFANGASLATVATFKAFSGSNLLLRAWNGTWQVMSSNVTSIS